MCVLEEHDITSVHLLDVAYSVFCFCILTAIIHILWITLSRLVAVVYPFQHNEVVIYQRAKTPYILLLFRCNQQSWTLISTHIRNVAKQCFSANVPTVLIFGLLVRTGTINDFSC